MAVTFIIKIRHIILKTATATFLQMLKEGIL